MINSDNMTSTPPVRHSGTGAAFYDRVREDSQGNLVASLADSPSQLSHSELTIDDLSRVHGEVQIPDIEESIPDEEAAEPFSPNDPDHPHHRRPKFSWRVLWAYTGPGWLMSIAYLDPGNLESDLQAGAYTGYQLLWVLLWATVLGLVLQILAARLGVVTGKHLAQVCRENYNPKLSKALWLMTEVAIIGSDIQEVIGSAIAFKILFGLPLWAGVLITGADTFSFLLLHALGVRKLEAFFATLIGTMCVCFFVDFGLIAPSGSQIMHGLLPDVSDYAVIQAVGILGAVIMPHNIYLHSALVQSRDIDRSRVGKVKEANLYFSIEAAVALGVSFFINAAVVAVFAKGFFNYDCAVQGLALVQGDDGISTCSTIGLQEAGDALKSALGHSASTIWAVGLLAAGQSSTMTGTFAGQYVMEGFLTLKLSPWKRVAFTRSIALIPAVLVAVVARSADSHSGDTLDEYLNILQSIQLPFALLPILHFTSSKRIMGESFVNGHKFQMFGWALVFSIIAINFYLIASQILDFSVSGLPPTWWMYTILVLFMIGYLTLIFLIIRNDIRFFIAYIHAHFHPELSTVGMVERFDQPEEGSPAWIALQASGEPLSSEPVHSASEDGLTQVTGSSNSSMTSSPELTPAEYGANAKRKVQKEKLLQAEIDSEDFYSSDDIAQSPITYHDMSSSKPPGH